MKKQYSNKMFRPPWVREPEQEKLERADRGNHSPTHATYNDAAWRKYSKQFLRKNPKCADGCGRSAHVTDHIIPVNAGGSMWDTRNHQPLNSKCHNIKSGRETHGIVEESLPTASGLIPKRNAHRPESFGNQSYLTQGPLKF